MGRFKDLPGLSCHKTNHPDPGTRNEDVCLTGDGTTDKPGYPVFGKNIGSLCQSRRQLDGSNRVVIFPDEDASRTGYVKYR